MKTRIEKRRPKLAAGVEARTRPSVDQRVQRVLERCPYSFYFNRVTWSFDGSCLTVEGSVPTFYMKQMLQTILRTIDGVEDLINNVDVVSSTGLSTVQPMSLNSRGSRTGK